MYTAVSTNSLVESSFLHADSGVWRRLHMEREDVSEALLAESRTGRALATDWQEAEDTARELKLKRCELFQTRLHQIDDALDRLMAGSYGDCVKCRRWIEDTRLAADPTLALCIECQRRADVEH